MQLLSSFPQLGEGLSQVFVYLSYHGKNAALPFLQASSYLYWPYLVSTLVLACLFGRQVFFRKALWTAPSALLDYQIYFINAFLWPLVAAVVLLNEWQVAAFLRNVLGVSTSASSTDWVTALAYTAAVFVAHDLGRFISHWLLHRFDFLWEIHQVHHSATVMTPITSYRVHPIELALMSTTPTLLVALTTVVFNFCFGAAISVYLFLGMHVVLAAASFIDNLRHSPVWLTYGQTLGKWLISPAHHQLHHSCEQRHWGCNLGSNLAVWDRLNGTLVVPKNEPEVFELGLAPGGFAANPMRGVWEVYVSSTVACVKVLLASLRPAARL